MEVKTVLGEETDISKVELTKICDWKKTGFFLGLLGCGGAIIERGTQGKGRKGLAGPAIPLNLIETLLRMHLLRRGAQSKHLCGYTSQGLAASLHQLTKIYTLLPSFSHVKKEIK